jgi:hypothetical protein
LNASAGILYHQRPSAVLFTSLAPEPGGRVWQGKQLPKNHRQDAKNAKKIGFFVSEFTLANLASWR